MLSGEQEKRCGVYDRFTRHARNRMRLWRLTAAEVAQTWRRLPLLVTSVNHPYGGILLPPQALAV